MKFKSDIEVQAGLKDSSGAVGTSGQVLSSTASGVSWITQSISGYVPYTGATANVNLGAYSITADSFIKIGGTADQYLKADGSVSTAMNSRIEADFVATSGQTTFVTPYEVGQIDVYYNGSKLYPNEFTATNGTDVVLAQAATLGAQISIVKYVSSFNTTSIRTESVFTTTGGQTTFAVNYAIGQVDVFYNGSKLSPAEFTATNGTSVVLGFACAAGESVVIDSFVNQVSGAVGTANKVAKFTGTASLGDSQITDNGTSISMFTNSPESGWKLDIGSLVALGSAPGNGRLYISSANTTNGVTYIQARNTTVPTPLSYVASSHTFDTNVGIANTNPIRRLEVASDGTNWISGTFSGTGNTDKVVIGNLTTPTIGGHNAGLGAWSDFTVAGANINFAPYGSIAMRLADTGNLGISNLSPVTKLSLNGYSGARLPYINNTTYSFNTEGITVGSSTTASSNKAGGLDLTNNTYSIGAFSPIISFSSLTSNSVYNNAYAGIWGVLGGQAGDANWVKGDLVFGTAPSNGIVERMRITSGGNLLLRTTTDSGYQCTINSTAGNLMYFTLGSGNVQMFMGSNSDFYISTANSQGVKLAVGATSWSAYSDIRLKNITSNIENALDSVDTLSAVRFTLKSDATNKPRVGLIAQEVQEVLPEAVDIDDKGMLSVRYTELIPLLVASIKELKAEIERISAKV